ncbi:TPA: glycosyltransferase family 2 protein, partial [Proteus mirabilis]|nr:glycosyltransferase family 2 protein [Proteus mirabilis]
MRVSVIITTRNRPFFLKRAINSVLTQSILPYELIIIDDNSDNKFRADNINFKGVKFIYHYNSKKMGGNYSRNLGVKKSSGDI